MAEINGAGFRKPDPRKALQKYLEALLLADEAELDPMSDEVTGIKLKVAEMYEALDRHQAAVEIYMELALTYMLMLRQSPLDAPERPALVYRELKMAIIAAVEMLAFGLSAPPVVLNMLLPHLATAQREAMRASPEVARQVRGQDPEWMKLVEGRLEGRELEFSSTTAAAYGESRSELFAMREMLTALALSDGDYFRAIGIKAQTTRMMMTAGVPQGDALLSLVNLASLYAMMAGTFDGVAAADGAGTAGAVREFAAAPEVPAAAVEALAPDAAPEAEAGAKVAAAETTQDDAKDNTLAPIPNAKTSAPAAAVDVSSISPVPSTAAVEFSKKSSELLDAANNIYTTVVRTIDGLGVLARRNGMVPHAYAMAIYGQGLVAVNRGDWATAADKLQEARIRARGLQLEALLDTVTDEIAKLDRLRDSGLSRAELAPAELPAIDVMLWQMEPEAIGKAELADK